MPTEKVLVEGTQLRRHLIYGVDGEELYPVQVDGITQAIVGIDYGHHVIHDGDSFSAFYTRTTAATNGHRSGLYIKTPAGGGKLIHAVVQISGSTACNYSICEGPTIASNVGTHANTIFNRYRDNTGISGCLDNATTPAEGKFTTLNETQIAADETFSTGMVLRTAPLVAGGGPKPAGGVGRDTQEYILKAGTAYILLITNTSADANVHHILLDWYEHVNRSA